MPTFRSCGHVLDTITLTLIYMQAKKKVDVGEPSQGFTSDMISNVVACLPEIVVSG